MRYGAPISIMVCTDLDKAWKNDLEDGYTSAYMAATIAGVQMMLEAVNLGLGTLWVRKFNAKELQESFDLPQNIIPVFILNIGYEKEDSYPSKWHEERNKIEDEVIYL